MPIIKPFYKLYRAFPDPDYVYFTNTYNGNNTLTVSVTSGISTDLSYSLDKISWTDIHTGGSVTVPQGGKVYLRSSTGIGTNDMNHGRTNLKMSQSCTLGGDFRTLVNYLDVENVTTLNSTLRTMFEGNTYLTDASDLYLNIQTFTQDRAFMYMFSGCSSLCYPPNFDSVTNLTYMMFNRAFSGCSMLMAPPSLKGLTTIDKRAFDDMFSGCSSLTTGIDFRNVTSVSNNISACVNVYSGCSSLNLAYAPRISGWNTSTFSNWLNGVAASGVVMKPSTLTITSDSASGVPSGWTTQDY